MRPTSALHLTHGNSRSAPFERPGALIRSDLSELMTLTAQGKVTLHTSAYPLEAVNDAMADLNQGRLQGRGILVAAT